MPETHTLIIGASHAGTQAAVSLRQAGYTGHITLFGEENGQAQTL